jgi:hypothetical protein
MKVTDAKIMYAGQGTDADSFGNNIAWKCPSCEHPVLFVCLDNQKGWGQDNWTPCEGCERQYCATGDEQTVTIFINQ